jgi:hypothetical protein
MLDQTNTTPDGGSWGVTNQISVAQTFTAGLGGALSTVDVAVGRSSSCDPGTDLTVEIRPVVSGLPHPSTVIASTTVPRVSIPQTDFPTAATAVDFPTPATVTAGIQYAIVLRAPGAQDCVLDPGPPTLTEAGTYWWASAAAGGPATYPGGTLASTDINDNWIAQPTDAFFSTYVQTIPDFFTETTPSVSFGDQIFDTATLSEGTNPTGTITFRLYGPDDPICSAGSLVFTDTVPVSGNGAYESAGTIPPQLGEWRWTAEYSGDNDNIARFQGCNAPNETALVSKRSTSISTQASADITLGGSVHDTATLSGGVGPAGTITFRLYGPDEPNCGGAPAFTSTVPVSSGNGSYDSADFTPAQAGTYRWTAEYSGDGNHDAASSGCNAAGETVTVAPMPTPPTPDPDTSPPETRIVHMPAKPHGKISFFRFVSSEPGSTFMCRLDRRRFRPCTSPVRRRGLRRRLRPGLHRFRVFAMDAAGNQDPTPAKGSFRIAPRKPGPMH